MDPFSIMLVAVGLSIDSFAVAVASGISNKNLTIMNMLKIATFFGGFQALMMILGWYLGLGISWFISGIDHWIAFAILIFIGAKMIYESVKVEDEVKRENLMGLYPLLLLSIATSIDSLAVGLGLSLFQINVLTLAVVTGIVCFAISFSGAYVSRRMGKHFGDKIKVLGGLILILIGIRILIEHLLG